MDGGLIIASLVALLAIDLRSSADSKMHLCRSSDYGDLAQHIERHNAENGAGEVFMLPQPTGDLLRFYNPDAWTLDTKTPGWQRVWVATFEERIVAHVVLTAYDQALLSHRVLLGLGVERAHRAHGLGRKLMNCALDFARAHRQLRYVDGQALSHLDPVLHLDYSVGFNRTGYKEKLFRFQDEWFDVVDLTLDLSLRRT